MESTSKWTAGINNPWQKLVIGFGAAVILTLCTVIGVMWYNMQGTIDYERGEKKRAQQETRDCEMEKYQAAVNQNASKEKSLKVQDTLKNVLNIQQ